MEPIPDYSTFLEDKRRVAPSGYEDARYPDLFDTPGTCPFCRAAAPAVLDERASETKAQPHDHAIHRAAWQCPCGWWQTYRQDWRWDTPYEWGTEQVRSAVLRRYNPSDSNLPLIALRKALISNPNLIDGVSARKTEELVGSIFGDFFDCDVKLVGKSGDGGIDLVLVLGDREVLVQVKHRNRGSHKWQAEPVASVREFLGAAVLYGGRHTILVTTAQHYSRQAQEAATKAVALHCVTQYDLFDINSLLITLQLTSDRIQNHWREHCTFDTIVD